MFNPPSHLFIEDAIPTCASPIGLCGVATTGVAVVTAENTTPPAATSSP